MLPLAGWRKIRSSVSRWSALTGFVTCAHLCPGPHTHYGHGGRVAPPPADHHSEYLAEAVAALTPEGRARVDELLDELAEAAGGRERLVRFAAVRRTEADTSQLSYALDELSAKEIDALRVGFM